MRVVYVSTYLPKQCGIATYTDYLVHAIQKEQPEVSIKIVAEYGSDRVKKKNFEVVPCWTREENYVEPILTQIEPGDIVHIQHEYSIYRFDGRLPTLLQKLDNKAKRIITIHCIRPTQFSERGSVDEDYAVNIANLADEVILHLPAQKSILIRRGIPEKKIHVIPHGTEIADENQSLAREKLNLPHNARILLMFGFIKRHKNFHVVLESLSEIIKKFENTIFFIAGGLAPTASKKDQEYADFLANEIEKFGLKNNVIYPNRFFPNEDVPYLLRSADIVLFPYYEEDRSASGSFHLAIGAKKPVIASRMPKFEELKNVSDELLVLPYNSTGIARITIRLFEDKKFLKYILDRTEEYRQETSWTTTALKHLALYQ
jgi:glycosyltransferase involved in cell wall biosynthesis